MSARGLVDLLASVVWVAWFVEVVKLVHAVIARVKQRDLVMSGAGLRDRFAVRIAALVIVISPVSVASSAGAFAAQPSLPASPSISVSALVPHGSVRPKRDDRLLPTPVPSERGAVLPELAALGLTSLAAATAVRRAGRQRRISQMSCMLGEVAAPLSPDITTDAQRFEAFIDAAALATDPVEIMNLLCAGLELIEGQSLANASRYGWWTGDGFDARVRSLVVDAACKLAPIAVDAGDQRIAQWGMEQARLVNPYDETLYRVAIESAALAGNARWAYRMWTQCNEMMNELAPGSLPSTTTEQAYLAALRLFDSNRDGVVGA